MAQPAELSERTFFERYRRKFALMLGVLWLMFCFTWMSSGEFRGSVVACFDLLRGRTELVTVGLALPRPPEYERLLLTKYGIRIRDLGCVADPRYIEGYDDVMLRIARLRFGGDVFERTRAEAHALYWREVPANQRTKLAEWLFTSGAGCLGCRR